MKNTHKEAAESRGFHQFHPLSMYGQYKDLIPGLLVCTVIALAASFISGNYGGPLLLYALLIGLSFHFIYGNSQAIKGVDFCGRTILRFGVALLGVRITFNQMSQLGLSIGAFIALSMTLTILLGLWLAHLLGLKRDQGLLSGGSVAICGASAALAISAVLPQNKENEKFTLLAVVSVTVLSTISMILYPFLVQLLQLPALASGVFLGGTIHDVAQVVAAGMLISPEVADAATLVKLFRVMLLLPVVLTISYLVSRKDAVAKTKQKTIHLPSFLIGFFILMVFTSTFHVPSEIVKAASDISRICLVLAIAAVGIKTNIGDLFKLGWKPLTLFVIETLFIGLFVMIALLMNFIL